MIPISNEETKMGNVLKGLQDFLNTGWGKGATRFLKEEAVLKVLVDKEPFSLSKRGDKMEMNPGIPANYSVLLEISSPAIEYLVDSKTEDEAHERLSELIQHPSQERYARMRIEVEPTEKGRIDFYWQGFFFWARRLGFVF
jgi:hypothetical protein